MKHTPLLITAMLIAALITTSSAQPVAPALPPNIIAKVDSCLSQRGTPTLVYPERNETGGPYSDKPLIPIDVICEFTEARKVSSGCDDGTKVGECSLTQPLKCTTRGLIEKCSICGCPDGGDCAGESCISTTSTSSTTTTSSSTTSSTIPKTTTSTPPTTTSTVSTFTTSSTIPPATTTQTAPNPPKITGKATSGSTSSGGRMLVFSIGALLAYALVRLVPASRKTP